MTPRRLRTWSLISLVLSVVGFFVFLFLGLAIFPHEQGMAWAYPMEGSFGFLALASVLTAVVSRELDVKERAVRRYAKLKR